MSLHDLHESLACINPYGKLNPRGNCVHCAIHTADVLVNNTLPRTVNGSITSFRGLAPGTFVRFEDVWNHSSILLAYLIGQGVNQVYAVETEDHAFNFVVDSRNYVYVLDSNQQFYRHIQRIEDFVATGHNESVDSRYEIDYANPIGDDSNEIDIYPWGELSLHWRRIIESRNLGILQSPGGAYTV